MAAGAGWADPAPTPESRGCYGAASGVWLRGTAEPSGAMPTNFTVVPVEARADGTGDEAAERTEEEPGSPESADPACSTPGELGRTCRGTKAESGWALSPPPPPPPGRTGLLVGGGA